MQMEPPIDALESLEPMTALAKAQSDIVFGTAADALARLDPENLNSKVCLPDASKTCLLKENQKLETVSPIYIRDPDAVAAKGL